MNVEYVARNCRFDDGLREYAAAKLQKVRRFVDEPVEVHIILEVEKHRQIAELQVRHRHGTLQAKEETVDPRDAINIVVDKVEKQARRSHKKYHQSRRRRLHRPESDDWSMAVVEAASVAAGSEPRIIETSMLPVKPMSIDEAVLELDGGRREFVVFRDAESDQINVLYRRRDGNYGLIIPDT